MWARDGGRWNGWWRLDGRWGGRASGGCGGGRSRKEIGGEEEVASLACFGYLWTIVFAESIFSVVVWLCAQRAPEHTMNMLLWQRLATSFSGKSRR